VLHSKGVREGDGQEYQKHWINPRKIFFFLKGVVIHFGWHLSTLHKKFLKDKTTPISSRKKRKQPSIEELQSLLSIFAVKKITRLILINRTLQKHWHHTLKKIKKHTS
jgi:hypothetical protein